jgi:hypothetical protein
MNSFEGRGQVFTALGGVVKEYTSKPESTKYPEQERGFLNASASVMGVAASADVRTEANAAKVTGLISPSFVERLKEAKDQGKADMVADTTVNVLFKENVLISDNLKTGTGTLSNLAEFDRNSGKMKLRNITINDLTDQQKSRLAAIKSGPLGSENTQEDLWKAAGVNINSYKSKIDAWNKNVERQYSFINYSPSMQKAKNQNTWAEVMAAKSGIPAMKGQTYSEDLPNVISENKEELQQRLDKAVPGTVKVSEALSRVKRDMNTNMLFDRDDKLKQVDNLKKTKGVNGKENVPTRIRIGF